MYSFGASRNTAECSEGRCHVVARRFDCFISRQGARLARISEIAFWQGFSIAKCAASPGTASFHFFSYSIKR